MQPADEMKQPAVPFDDRSVNKLKQLRLDFVLENSVLFSSPVQSTGRAIVVTLASALP